MNSKILIGLLVLLAVGLSLSAQDLAYVLNEYVISAIPAVYYLTIFTIGSVGLFIAALYVIYAAKNKGQLAKNEFLAIFPVTITISVVATAWSLAVLVMWWR